MPTWELFEQQDESYRDEVLPPHITARVAVEKGLGDRLGPLCRQSGAIIGMHTFGASAPLTDLLKKFGFTPEKVYQAADRSADCKAADIACEFDRRSNPLEIACTSTARRSGSISCRAASSRRASSKKLVDDDGLRGVTSNPSIFEKAIGHSDEYDAAIARMLQAHDRAGRRTLTSSWRSKTSSTPPTCCARFTMRRTAPTALSASKSRPICAKDTEGTHRRSAAAVARGRPREPDDQGAGDAGGPAGDPRSDRRGHQRQHHAAVRAGGL